MSGFTQKTDTFTLINAILQQSLVPIKYYCGSKCNKRSAPWLEPEYTAAGQENRYLFGDKERLFTGRVNEYDFVARSYAASYGRFTSVDPLAEKTPWLSPYAYCANNPVNCIDPDGKDIFVLN